MAMQCEEKPRLLKLEMQTVAAELEKAEAKNLVEEVCKELGSVYHVRYFNDRQHLWTDIMEQQRERLASIVAVALRLYEFYAR